MAKDEDTDIWNFAAANGYSIVSKDKDFYQRSVAMGHPPKVIHLHIGNCSVMETAKILLANPDTSETSLPTKRNRIFFCLSLLHPKPSTHWKNWIDRHDRLPEPVKHLLTIARIKAEAAANQITSVEISGQRLMLQRNGSSILLHGSRYPRLAKTKPIEKLEEALDMLMNTF